MEIINVSIMAKRTKEEKRKKNAMGLSLQLLFSFPS